MIEVFKTNVKDHDDATLLVAQIHKSFSMYIANFDLDDCDKVLRIKCTSGRIQSVAIIELLKSFGFHAEVLSEDNPPLISGRRKRFDVIQK